MHLGESQLFKGETQQCLRDSVAFKLQFWQMHYLLCFLFNANKTIIMNVSGNWVSHFSLWFDNKGDKYQGCKNERKTDIKNKLQRNISHFEYHSTLRENKTQISIFDSTREHFVPLKFAFEDLA